MSHYKNPLFQAPIENVKSMEEYIRLESHGDRNKRESLLDTRREAIKLWHAILEKKKREPLHIIDVVHTNNGRGTIDIKYIDPELPYKNPMKPNPDMHMLFLLWLLIYDADDIVDDRLLEFPDVEDPSKLEYQTLRIVFK